MTYSLNDSETQLWEKKLWIKLKTLKKKGYFVGFFVESIKKEKSILITKQWRIYWLLINTEAFYQE